jgi:hypothetical protein
MFYYMVCQNSFYSTEILVGRFSLKIVVSYIIKSTPLLNKNTERTQNRHIGTMAPTASSLPPILFFSMASSSNGSPNYLRRRCVCNWGTECLTFKKLLAEAGDVLLTRMIPIQRGISETSVALRLAVPPI